LSDTSARSRPSERLFCRLLGFTRSNFDLLKKDAACRFSFAIITSIRREGIFREMKLRGHYEKPSEKKAREKAEAVRRARKLARKKLQREGLLPMKPKPMFGAGSGPERGGSGGRGGAGSRGMR